MPRAGSPAPLFRRPGAGRVMILLVIAMVGGLAACTSPPRIDAAAEIVSLPGAGAPIDFDDAPYATRLQRVLVPARDSGVYLVDPAEGTATRVPYEGPAASVDTDGNVLFVGDRTGARIRVVDQETGEQLSAVPTAGPPDYVRHLEARGELWVSEPAATPSGIEIFRLEGGQGDVTPQRVGFVPVADGPEGLTISRDQGSAYVHADSEVVVVDVSSRRIRHRWDTGCDGTHGFPRPSTATSLLLVSCADGGRVVLLSLRDGEIVGDHAVGGGESLPAYSRATGHFYVRSDPGDMVVTLKPSRDGLEEVGRVSVPDVGHCLGAHGRHYWTCDAERGRLLLFTDR